jgi:CBS domain containing-hemolysin-like protein
VRGVLAAEFSFSLTTVERAELERAAADAEYSRFPVTGNRAPCWATCTSKDTLGAADRDRPFPRAALHPITRVRSDTPLDDTLTALRAQRSHLDAVTGENGTVIGFVTMDDALSELVGPAPAEA